MAFNDLSEDAKAGWTWASNKVFIVGGTGEPKYATARELVDAMNEEQGRAYLQQRREARIRERGEKLERNAALAAQVDAA